jgi:CDP-diacylglycerol--serine O-phosphatidyltransferase
MEWGVLMRNSREAHHLGKTYETEGTAKDRLFLGVYDYTVVLTYISLSISMVGIFLAVEGNAVAAVACLITSGICDTCDGKIARTKKNRTRQEAHFGIQIDSLCDLISFGVLPCFVGYASGLDSGMHIALYCIYVLAAIIRLAYFNVSEQDRQDVEDGLRQYYIGLPVTSSSVILPFLYIIKGLIQPAFPVILMLSYPITAILFVSRVRVRKFGARHVAKKISKDSEVKI